MENNFLFILLAVVAGLTLIFLLIELWLRNRRKRKQEAAILADDTNPEEKYFVEEVCAISKPSHPQKTPEKHTTDSHYQDLIVISIMAKPNSFFESYDLFQAISTTGMKYGRMNIFHYDVETAKGPTTLFSLASATNPGEFNLDKMGEFSCCGLTLFTNLREVPDPEEAFETMLATAEQLADDLDGELRVGHTQPFTDEAYHKLQKKVLHIKQTQCV